MSKNHF